MGRIGGSELLVIVLLALVLFGGGRIADIGRGIGEGIKNFKKGIRDDEPPAPKPIDVKPDESSRKA
jgi:sec-independent protein translocase protein TatA